MSDNYYEATAPRPNFPERVTNTYETKIAENTSRQGRERVYEGLGIYYAMDAGVGHALAAFSDTQWAPAPIGSSMAPVGDLTERPRQTYDEIIAPGRGPVGSGNPMQHWTDEPAYLGAFFQGQNQRSATGNREVPGNTYETIIAPANGGRGVRNDAEVSG